MFFRADLLPILMRGHWRILKGKAESGVGRYTIMARFRIVRSALRQARGWRGQVLLAKATKAPFTAGPLQSLWYGTWCNCMLIKVQFNLAIQMPVRAWIAALIFFLRK
jgi:hypothetical protein